MDNDRGAILNGWLYIKGLSEGIREAIKRDYLVRLRIGKIAGHRIDYVDVLRNEINENYSAYRVDIVIPTKPMLGDTTGMYQLDDEDNVVLHIFGCMTNPTGGCNYQRKTGSEDMSAFLNPEKVV